MRWSVTLPSEIIGSDALGAGPPDDLFATVRRPASSMLWRIGIVERERRTCSAEARFLCWRTLSCMFDDDAGRMLCDASPIRLVLRAGRRRPARAGSIRKSSLWISTSTSSAYGKHATVAAEV